MQEESQQAATPANDDMAETPAVERDFRGEVELLAKGLDRMHTIYRELAQNLSSDKIFDSLIAGLSAHPNFNKLVNNLVQEGIAAFIAQQQNGEHHEYALEDEAGVKGYEVTKISRNPLDTTVLRVCQNDPEHPAAPNGFEGFILHEGEWIPAKLTTMMKAALALAFANPQDICEEPILSNAYYWVELSVYTSKPLDETSVEVSAPENSNGPEA